MIQKYSFSLEILLLLHLRYVLSPVNCHTHFQTSNWQPVLHLCRKRGRPLRRRDVGSQVPPAGTLLEYGLS